MTKNEVLEALNDMGVSPETISFYQDLEGEQLDTEFTYCEISGEQGDCVNCIALDEQGDVFQFMALESLVGSHLGSLAGAF